MAEETLDEKALRLLDLDPATHVVVGTPRFSKWQSGKDGMWMESVRVSVAERDQTIDYDSLVRQLRLRRPLRAVPPAASGDGDTFVFVMADWQLGKSDGDGVRGTVARVRAAVDQAAARVKALRRAGRTLDCLVLAGLGDIIEGCAGHYPSQQFTVALDRRQQCALARELIVYAIRVLAPLFPVVVLTAVPGNHGENRQGGKAVTGVSDNDDVAVFEQVWEAVTMSEAFQNVMFIEPTGDEVHVTLTGELWGAGLCMFHGHTSGNKDMQKWWAGQTQGHQAPGKANVLVTAHYHHLKISEESGRTWIQAPSPESCSQWWVNRSGQSSMPGTLSFVLTDEGVDDVKVLGRRVEAVAA